MVARPEEITSIIKQQIEQFGAPVTAVDVGTVVEIGDGIARIHGLAGALYGELLEFSGGVMGIALNLEEDSVGAMIMGDYTEIREGDEVRSTGRIAEVPGGEENRPYSGRGAHRPQRGGPQVGGHSGADRHQGHRRHDPHWPRPARA